MIPVWQKLQSNGKISKYLIFSCPRIIHSDSETKHYIKNKLQTDLFRQGHNSSFSTFPSLPDPFLNCSFIAFLYIYVFLVLNICWCYINIVIIIIIIVLWHYHSVFLKLNHCWFSDCLWGLRWSSLPSLGETKSSASLKWFASDYKKTFRKAVPGFEINREPDDVFTHSLFCVFVLW